MLWEVDSRTDTAEPSPDADNTKGPSLANGVFDEWRSTSRSGGLAGAIGDSCASGDLGGGEGGVDEFGDHCCCCV